MGQKPNTRRWGKYGESSEERHTNQERRPVRSNCQWKQEHEREHVSRLHRCRRRW